MSASERELMFNLLTYSLFELMFVRLTRDTHSKNIAISVAGVYININLTDACCFTRHTTIQKR